MQHSANNRSSPRHFLRGRDLSSAEITALLRRAAELKDEIQSGSSSKTLAGKTLAMIFEKPSSRTRLSFEVGMFQLGGSAININSSEIKMGEREPIRDVARTLSRYVDGVMIRAFFHWTLEEFAGFASVPLINGLSDHYHPCQALADILTLQQFKPDLRNVRLCYIGDGNNVCNSLIEICDLLDIHLTIACPERYKPLVRRPSRKLSLTTDPREACRGADAVYTDVWVSMGQEELTARKVEEFRGYSVTAELMRLAKPDAIFMHDLPAHRGLEVDDAVFESSQSVVFQQAENRLHAQKALLELLLSHPYQRSAVASARA